MTPTAPSKEAREEENRASEEDAGVIWNAIPIETWVIPAKAEIQYAPSFQDAPPPLNKIATFARAASAVNALRNSNLSRSTRIRKLNDVPDFME